MKTYIALFTVGTEGFITEGQAVTPKLFKESILKAFPTGKVTMIKEKDKIQDPFIKDIIYGIGQSMQM